MELHEAADDQDAGDDLGSLAGLLTALARTDAAALAPGAVIAGQYVIEAELGAGAMGVVYRARDRILDRAVAIKVGRVRSADSLRRFEREALALARLAHPNVVVVHQIGKLGARVFIVMEHVAGGTARTWLAAQARPWRAVIDLFLQAGDGLAAAHAVGLVHRDVKPDNILVGDDGRARVADFGLALAAPPAIADGGLVEALATRGALGTPAYMAPEQIDGAPVDARADQFAFAAALWEALFGARPFPGDTLRELRAAIATPPRPAAARGVPGAVVEVLRRGLAERATDRWPSMAALLAALGRAKGVRRRRALGAGAAVTTAAIAAAIVATRGGAPPDPCADGPALIARVWNPARAARLAAHLPASLAHQLDAYATRWALAHRDACRATRVERIASPAMLDRRAMCLTRVAETLDASLARLEGPGDASGALAVAALPDIDGCTAAALGAEEAPPTDPAQRARVDAAVAAVARTDAGASAWHDAEAEAKATTALATARAAGWRPVIARALLAVGDSRAAALDAAGALAADREAAELAIASGSDATAALALADQAWHLATLGRDAEAVQAMAVARAFVARGVDRRTHSDVLADAVHVELTAARFDAALAAARERIGVCDAGTTPLHRALARLALAQAALQAARPAEAVAPLDEALAILIASLGPDDVEVALALEMRAEARAQLGEADAALVDARQALALFEQRLGPRAPQLTAVLTVLGELARGRGDRDQAAAYWTRAAAVATDDPDHQLGALTNLAILDLEAGQAATGVARLEQVVTGFTAGHGADAPVLIEPLIDLGYGERALGRLADARAHHERAVAIARAQLAPTARPRINAQIELGNTLVAAGDRAAARALLAPLLAMVDAHADQVAPAQAAELRAALASAAPTPRREHAP